MEEMQAAAPERRKRHGNPTVWSGCDDGGGGRPVPWEQLIEAVERVDGDELLQNVAEVGKGLELVELGGLDQRGDDRPAPGAAITSDHGCPHGQKRIVFRSSSES